MDMTEVKAFNAELSALYDNKPPISKAKMSAITRGAIKAIKFYKHVVHSVEKFILKCKPEYKIPGLYVIDSIVRQSRHQFGADKDFFAPRFAKNMQQTFINLLRCPPEDKRNVIRVLNLWQKNSVFTPEVIQPLFDMVDPNHPIHQELLAQQPNHSNGSMASANNTDAKISPALASQHTPTVTPNPDQSGKLDAGIIAQIRQIQSLFKEVEPAAGGGGGSASGPQPVAQPVNFNRRLLNLDFEYDSEEDGGAADSSPPQQVHHMPHQHQQAMQPSYMHPQDTLGSILTNPEILRQLQSIQAQMMVANFPMQGMNLNMNLRQDMNYVDTSQPPPAIHNMAEEPAGGTSPLMDEVNNESDIEFVDDAGPPVIEIDGNDSRSPSPKSSRRRRSRSRGRTRRSRSRSRRGTKSRSRDRDRDRDRRRRLSRDRSRDKTTREKPRDREKDKEKEKEREKEKEKERERRKKGLPAIKKENLSVCSTTLWVGHLSKLVQGEELSDAFGAIGDVISIDLVPPRGCAFIVMNRRCDAARAISKLNKHKMHSKAITVAWAPGKGVKGREWKDFWEADAGACYVPWIRLPSSSQQIEGIAVLDSLEEGGVLDEETVPPWLLRKGSLLDNRPKVLSELTTLPPGILAPGSHPPGMMVMSPMPPPQNMGVDTSCLPPPLGSLAYAPHPALPLAMPLIGFKPSAQSGLEALHLQAVLAHQHQQQQQLAHQILLGPPPPRMPPHLAHTLPIPHPLTMPPALPLMETRQDDAMELDPAEDMLPSITQDSSKLSEDSGTSRNHPLSDQLKALLSNPPPSFSIPPPALPPTNKSLLGQPPPIGNHTNTSLPPPPVSGVGVNPPDGPNSIPGGDNKDRDKRDRDGRRDRDRRDRDRDRTRDRHDRDRDRERGGERDRERGDRDKERERDRGIVMPGERERGPAALGDREKLDKDRERGGDKDRERDRDRDRAGRDRGNRWGGREHRAGSRERSPGGLGRQGDRGGGPGNAGSLQDRLREMANGPGKRPHPRDSSPGRHSRNDRQSSSKDDPSGDGLLGDGPQEMDRRKGPPSDDQGGPGGPGMGMGRSPLPPMAPFRIGRDEIRMRGMGPRGPMGGMRPGMWTDGPAPFGPRFNGGPPFDRPSFDGPPFEQPNFDEVPFDGPPFEGPSFDGPPFDRQFDGPPFDRQFDRPHFDGPQFDRPPFDGPPDAFFERGGPPRGPRGLRASSDARRGRGERDGERESGRSRSSRWAGNESPDRNTSKSKKDSSPGATKLYDDEGINAVIDLDTKPDHSDDSSVNDKPKEVTKDSPKVKPDNKESSHVTEKAPSRDALEGEGVDGKSAIAESSSNFDMFSNEATDKMEVSGVQEVSNKYDSSHNQEFSDKETSKILENSNNMESSNIQTEIIDTREVVNKQELSDHIESSKKEDFSELFSVRETFNNKEFENNLECSKSDDFPVIPESTKDQDSLYEHEFFNARESTEKKDVSNEKDYSNSGLFSDPITSTETFTEKEMFPNAEDASISERLTCDIEFSSNDFLEKREESIFPPAQVDFFDRGESVETISEGGRGTPCRDEMAGSGNAESSVNEGDNVGSGNSNEVTSASSP